MKLLRRLRYWLDRSGRANSLSEEMQAHLEFKIDELVSRGLTYEEAASAARREFGNRTLIAETSRAIWIARYWTDLVQDLRYALRSLKQQPGFTVVAVLSATLGIAACTTVFSIANAALFRSLPLADAERVLSISRADHGKAGNTMSHPHFQEIRKAKTLESVAAYFPLVPASIAAKQDPRRHWGWLVSANYFQTVGVQPVLGRMFDPEKDDILGGSPTVILAHHVWQGRYNGDPEILNKPILFNGEQVMVAGIAPPGFRGHETALVADFWVPMSMFPRLALSRPDANGKLNGANHQWLMSVARARSGVTLESVKAELDVIAKRCQTEYPSEEKDWGFHAERAGMVNPGLRSLIQAFFSLLLAVTVLVLVIACANIANLLLARSSVRQREIATRLAIGASRWRLIRQLLVESLVLSGTGGAFGIVLAYWATAAIGKFSLPLPIPIDLAIAIDWHVMVFCAALSIVTGVLFGLVPALRASRQDLTASMKGSAGAVLGSNRFGMRNGLVILQVAVCVVLLTTAVLFLRSLGSVASMPLGLNTNNVLLVGVDPDLNGYTPQKAKEFLTRVTDSIRSLPGVESASYTNLVPLSLAGNSGGFRNGPADQAQKMSAQIAMIGPRYFETLDIPILRGEDFARAGEGRERVIIVNQFLAGKLFPSAEALGQQIWDGTRPYRIVAVAANSKSRNVGEEQRAQVYLPATQAYGETEAMIGMTLLIRTRSNPEALAPAIRREIQAIDPALAIFDVRSFDDHLQNAFLMPRLAALLFGLCGAMGLIIATIGLYGVISFLVARRTKEMGIRMALGARPGEVVLLVLRAGLTVALTGILIGGVLAFGAAAAARSLLYGVSPSDPLTFTAVPVFLLAVAAGACAAPALRASKLSPLRTLRYE